MLLNNLNLSTGYDLDAKQKNTLAWSPVRISGGTQLFKDKMAVNFGTTLDPYAIDNSGNRINIFNINNGGSLLRMTSANMTLNYSLTSKKENDENKKNNNQGKRNGGRDDDLFGGNNDLANNRKSQFNEEDEEDDDAAKLFMLLLLICCICDMVAIAP